jgi:hypothetical protein
MSEAELLKMVDAARDVRIGLWGPEHIVYVAVTKDAVRKAASEIISHGLTVEMGDPELGISDVLYIESARSRS